MKPDSTKNGSLMFRLVLASILSCVGAQLCWADSFVFDPIATSKVVLPAWIPDWPVASVGPRSELAVPIRPGVEDLDLAVTVVFREEIGGYLAVFWEPSFGSRQQLSENLFENIGIPNERTLLIARPTMGGAGRLIFASSSSALNIIRIRFDWVRPGVVRLADTEPNGALVMTGSKILAPEEVDGSPLTPIADSWAGKTLTTSITDNAQRIENGVDFPINIPAQVGEARVELVVDGLPLNGALSAWLNGLFIGNLAVETPDLRDPGFGVADDGTQVYVGWRKASIFLPNGYLQVGDNQIQFGTPVGSEIAIRDFLLQVHYAPN
ncbi:MAG: hypothetical protein JO308_08770 [Verrucomicrobia bacterium]|nr:hypothetical protein [Verrucomicrobiota bacterium]